MSVNSRPDTLRAGNRRKIWLVAIILPFQIVQAQKARKFAVDVALLLAVVLATLVPRLYEIRGSLTDYHSWRQTHTAMVARNFLTNGFNILNPQVDQIGPDPQFFESEFPLYQFAVALLYTLTGAEDWAARAVAVAFSCAAAASLYLLVRSFAGRLPAFLAGLLFAISPFEIFFGRAVMPESAMIFFSISSLGLLHQWLHRRQSSILVGAIATTTLAIAVKLPAAHILLPAAYLIWSHHGRAALRDMATYAFIAGSLLPPAAWYGYAAEAGRRSGVSLAIASSAGGGRLGSVELWLNPDFYRLLGQWMIDDVSTLAGAPLFALGLTLAVIWALSRKPVGTTDARSLQRRTFARFLVVWAVAVFLYFLGAANGLANQEYYMLPAVPVASILAGLGLATICGLRVKQRSRGIAPAPTTHAKVLNPYGVLATVFAAICLVLIALLSFERISPLYAQVTPYVETGKMVMASTPKDAAVIAVHHGEPEVLYYARRRGWNMKPEDFSLAGVETLRSQGATTIAIAEAVPLAGSERVAEVLRMYPALVSGPFHLIIDLTRQEGQRKLAKASAFTFGQVIRLTGYETGTVATNSGGAVDVILRWQALQPMAQSYHVSLRLFTAGGKLVTQLDGVPANWFFPTTRWQPGDVVEDPYRLTLPEGTPPGQLRLEIVVYDGANLRPLTVDETGKQSLDLGPVEGVQ